MTMEVIVENQVQRRCPYSWFHPKARFELKLIRAGTKSNYEYSTGLLFEKINHRNRKVLEERADRDRVAIFA